MNAVCLYQLEFLVQSLDLIHSCILCAVTGHFIMHVRLVWFKSWVEFEKSWNQTLWPVLKSLLRVSLELSTKSNIPCMWLVGDDIRNSALPLIGWLWHQSLRSSPHWLEMMLSHMIGVSECAGLDHEIKSRTWILAKSRTFFLHNFHWILVSIPHRAF